MLSGYLKTHYSYFFIVVMIRTKSKKNDCCGVVKENKRCDTRQVGEMLGQKEAKLLLFGFGTLAECPLSKKKKRGRRMESKNERS